MTTLIIGGLLILAILFAGISMRRNKKKGNGCCGTCSGCSGCSKPPMP